MHKLKDHILGRLLKREFDGDTYASLQTKTKILSEYRVNAYIDARHFELTIQHTIFNMTETQ